MFNPNQQYQINKAYRQEQEVHAAKAQFAKSANNSKARSNAIFAIAVIALILALILVF